MDINGTKLIARKGDTYYFAESAFSSRGVQGVVGYAVSPVSQETWDWASDPETVEARLEELWDEHFQGDQFEDCDECEGHAHPLVGCDNCNIPTLAKWTADAIRHDGIKHLMFTCSFEQQASAAFSAYGIEHVTTDCHRYGRVFMGVEFDDFDKVYDELALRAILAIEAGEGFTVNSPFVFADVAPGLDAYVND